MFKNIVALAPRGYRTNHPAADVRLSTHGRSSKSNSAGVRITAGTAKKLGWVRGDRVLIEYDPVECAIRLSRSLDNPGTFKLSRAGDSNSNMLIVKWAESDGRPTIHGKPIELSNTDASVTITPGVLIIKHPRIREYQKPLNTAVSAESAFLENMRA